MLRTQAQFLVVDMMPYALARQASMDERAGFIDIRLHNEWHLPLVGAASEAMVLRMILRAV